MMMSALQAGGMTLLVDQIRKADANNPKGYYEFERVKKLPKGDTGWLKLARGKAVKIISALLEYLPPDDEYQIIFMERDLDEVLSSQQRMLERNGRENDHPVSDEEIRESYQAHLVQVRSFIDTRHWIQSLFVSYNDILSHPHEAFLKIADFLDEDVDPNRMALVVEPNLYREKR